MDRAQKETVVADLKAQFAEAGCVVVGHYRGLSVAQMETLRANMRDGGAKIQVAKNRLSKLALADTPYASLADLFTGPTIVATSSDPVAAAKAAQTFADEHKLFIIQGGGLGDKQLDAEGVKALAKLPSLDELRSKLLGLLQAPATKVATVTAAPATKLARVISMKPDQANAA